MAKEQANQERTAAMFMSGASVVLAVFAHLSRPEVGAFVEAEPDLYVLFKKVLHGLILLILVFMVTRVSKITADRPGLRLPLLVMMLFGIGGAAYVVALDFNVM
ncbi:MAG: hypothetical protein ABI459_11130 [Deltaproteobacteria bacterium]